MKTDGVSALDYTPRQGAFMLKLDRTEARRVQAQLLSIAAMGARGEWRDVQNTVKEWGR